MTEIKSSDPIYVRPNCSKQEHDQILKSIRNEGLDNEIRDYDADKIQVNSFFAHVDKRKPNNEIVIVSFVSGKDKRNRLALIDVKKIKSIV